MKRIVVLLLLIGHTAFAQPGTWKKMDHADFSISYPPDWTLDMSGMMGTKLLAFAPMESARDVFRENVNLIVQDLTGYGVGLDTFTVYSLKQLAEVMADYSLKESVRLQNANGDVHKLVYDGAQGKMPLSFVQYYMMHNEKAYVLTFTAERSRFADWQQTGEQLLRSFILKK
jgi:hypothetical protein